MDKRNKYGILIFNDHHIRPRSRFKRGTPKEDMDEKNTVLLPVEFHALWHAMFSNMTPEEACIFIRTVMQPDTAWTQEKLNRLKRHIMEKP